MNNSWHITSEPVEIAREYDSHGDMQARSFLDIAEKVIAKWGMDYDRAVGVSVTHVATVNNVATYVVTFGYQEPHMQLPEVRPVVILVRMCRAKG